LQIDRPQKVKPKVFGAESLATRTFRGRLVGRRTKGWFVPGVLAACPSGELCNSYELH
jgi:hypothetical protein